MEARRLPRHQQRRHPRDPEPGVAGIRLFPERRFDPPPGHRGRDQPAIEGVAALCQLRARGRALPRHAAGRLQQPVCRCRTATSRSCRATGSRRFRATGSRPASTIPITDAFKVGGDALFVSDQYFVGDESNQAQRLPSYTVFNAHASYQINKTFQIYGRVDNIARQSLRDLRHLLRYRRDAQFRQWRRAVHRRAFGQPGAAARLLRGAEGDVLSSAPNWKGFRQRPGRECRAAPCGSRTERTRNASGTRG